MSGQWAIRLASSRFSSSIDGYAKGAGNLFYFIEWLDGFLYGRDNGRQRML